MEQTKEQEILVYTDFTNAGDKAVEWGIFLAKELKKNLFILHVINENTPTDNEYGDAVASTKNRLKVLCEKIGEEENIIVKSDFEQGCTCTIINTNAERRDALFVIAAIHGLNDLQYLSGKALIKIARKARIPYLILHKESPSPASDRTFLFPVSMAKEMKQKVGWATFFAFRMKLKVEIVIPKNTQDIATNLQFTKKFFDSFDIDYFDVNTSGSQFNTNKEALKIADISKHLMMCAITSVSLSLFDRIFGPDELRIASNSKRLPILMINPRKDLYIPCV